MRASHQQAIRLTWRVYELIRDEHLTAEAIAARIGVAAKTIRLAIGLLEYTYGVQVRYDRREHTLHVAHIPVYTDMDALVVDRHAVIGPVEDVRDGSDSPAPDAHDRRPQGEPEV